MKRIKKITAALMALVIMLSTAACSADKSWAMKNDSMSAPIGVYIYYLYAAYQSAGSSVKIPPSRYWSNRLTAKVPRLGLKTKHSTIPRCFFSLMIR